MDYSIQTFDQETAPMHPPEIPQVTPVGKNKKQGKRVETLKEFGQLEIPTPPSNIHCMSIVGQVEGHMVLPPQNKTTKYEHIIPQLLAVEQSPPD